MSPIHQYLPIHSVFNALPGNSVLLQADAPRFTIDAVTDGFCGITGRSREALVGAGIFEVFPGSIQDNAANEAAVRASLAEVLTSGKEVSMPQQEYIITNSEGALRRHIIRASYRPVADGDGRVSAIVHIVEDITTDILQQEAIHQNSIEFRFALDMMPQLVWVTESNGYSVFFNHGWLDYTGLTYDDVKGDGWTQSLHPDDLERTFDAWRSAVERDTVYDVEYRLRRHDGKYRWFVARGVPLKDEKNRVLKWYGTSTDIHRQKEAEDALRRSQERFELVSKATQDAIWDWNLLTNEIWWNEGFRTMFGYREDEIEPGIESWYNRVHPDDKEWVIGGVHAAIDGGGKQWSGEYRFRKADGSYATVFDRGYALHLEDGTPYRMLGSMQDITVRKEVETVLEERVQQRTAELEQRNRELEQFTYVSHHDLQEPLRKIIMFIDMIAPEAAAKLSDSARMRLEKVTEAARRMSNALRDVLNYASLNKPEQNAEVDLNQVLLAVEQDLELAIAERSAIIDAQPLPVITGVAQQMHQLFYNLLNNALKFARPGVAPFIRISCSLESGNHLITVEDNGIGFNNDAAEKIFVMFQRLHAKSQYAGTGIGLALCQKVVENHGGTIQAEGRPGQGAIFHISLPAIRRHGGSTR